MINIDLLSAATLGWLTAKSVAHVMIFIGTLNQFVTVALWLSGISWKDEINQKGNRVFLLSLIYLGLITPSKSSRGVSLCKSRVVSDSSNFLVDCQICLFSQKIRILPDLFLVMRIFFLNWKINKPNNWLL